MCASAAPHADLGGSGEPAHLAAGVSNNKAQAELYDSKADTRRLKIPDRGTHFRLNPSAEFSFRNKVLEDPCSWLGPPHPISDRNSWA